MAVTLPVITKNKIFTLIIMTVLAIGLACFIPWNWLHDYPYYMDFKSLLYVFAALLVVVSALPTIVVTYLHAACTDPALRLQIKTRVE